MDDEYINPKQAKKILKVTDNTLINWTEKGILESIKTAGGHRRYKLLSVIDLRNQKTEKTEEERRKSIKPTKINYCYARVSSQGQKEDLERQIRTLRERYPNHTIIRDIGSGLNFKRKGFNSLVDLALKGEVGEIVVTHKDRLCRFGFEFIQDLFWKSSKVKLVVLNKTEDTPEKELTDDIISIITVFSARLHGRRSWSNASKKEKQEETE
jgi:predicted site-specific integrase-resolvase